jgi:hypothetical protein
MMMQTVKNTMRIVAVAVYGTRIIAKHSRLRLASYSTCLILLSAGGWVSTAQADEGGVSFWLPGQQGSFAAVPMDPGWTLPIIYYHADLEAQGSAAFQFGGSLAGGLNAFADLAIISPTYAFSEPVLGGQLALSLGAIVGRAEGTAEVTISGPGGGSVTFERTDEVFGVGDLYPTATLRWNDGTSNYMTYLAADIPIGDYEEGRIANIGINHWAIDAGAGYTYLNPQTGHEFSAVAGLTFNFENPDTDYQNGIDFHLDWAASQFLSEQSHIGLVGYYYQQLTGDSGNGATLGEFKSRVVGIGPQFGYFFPLDGHKAYFNLKGYYEFAAENRLEGWNAWVTLALPLGASTSQTTTE